MARTYQLGRVRRLVNILVESSLRAGLPGAHTYLLSVVGRRSGKIYSTPVILVENDERWLVAPYGNVGWVRNARAAGEVTLSRRRHKETVKISEVGPQQSAPILRKYLRQVKVVRPFFDVTKDSPLDAFAAEADRHPVFRVEAV